MNSHSISYYVKSALIVSAIFYIAFLLSSTIIEFSKTGNIFSISLNYSIKVGALMLLLMYLYTLSVGAWDKWEQFAIIPIPTALGVALSMVLSSQAYASYTVLTFLVLLEIFIWNSNNLKKLLLKFSPIMIMRPVLHGALFLFSLLSGALIILNPTTQDINIGNKIGTMIEEPLKQAVTKQVPEQMRPFLLSGVDFKGLAEAQINKTVEPYKNYIKPIMAVLTFFLFQFYGSIAFFVYSMTANVLMWVAIKTKLIKIELVEVPQEILRF
jgi:hypothetical protein